jgi:peptide/nickel transport system substrate-binding protein
MKKIQYQKLIVIFLLLFGVILQLFSGGNQQQVPQQQVPAQPTGQVIFRMTMNADPDSLDPHKSSASITEQVMLNVFDGLVIPTPDGGVEPGLAEAYTISHDGLVYRFTLRNNIYFHNGNPVNINDVIFTLNRLRGANGEAKLTSELDDVVSLQAIDNRTLEIVLGKPNSSFITFMYRAIIPEGYDDQANNPIGAGPFRFVEYLPQNRIILERFDQYYRSQGDIDRVIIRIITDPDARLLALQSGDIDFTGVSSQRVDDFRSRFQIIQAEANSVFIFGMNNEHPVLSDVRVRQAINYALDRQEIIDFVFNGFGTELVSSMSPAMAQVFNESLLGNYNTNLTKARELLSAAGYPQGFQITLRISGHSEIYSDTAQVIQQQLARVGIQVNIEVIEWSMWLSEIYTDRSFETTLIDFTGKLDPYPVLRRYLTNFSRNFLNHRSSRFDDIIEAALRSSNPQERNRLYKEAQAILVETVPAAFLADYQFIWAMNPRFTGYTPYPFFFHDLTKISLAQQ